MTDIWKGDGVWAGWHLTTDHPASSHGQPVLVDPNGTAYGPGDIQSAPTEFIGAAEFARLLGTSQQNVSLAGQRALKPTYRGKFLRPDAVFEGRPLWRRDRAEEYARRNKKI